MSQRAFEDKLSEKWPRFRPGPSSQYISKIETGVIQWPGDDEFWEALSLFASIPRADLEDLARRPMGSHEQRRIRSTFCVAAGHCIWAAPLVLAAREGMIEEYFHVVTSRVGEAFSPIAEPLSPEKIPSPRNKDVVSLSAIDVLDCLRREGEDKNRVDLAIVPGKLVDEAEKSLLRIGCIVDSWTGCSLVCRKEFEQRLAGRDGNLTEVTSRALASALVTPSSRGRPVAARFKIALEEGTVADEILKEGMDVQWGKDSGRLVCDILHPCRNRDFAVEKKYEDIERAVGKDFSLAGVLTWDPHATWLKKTAEKREDLTIVPVKFPVGEDGRAAHLTFELVIRSADAISTEPRAKELRHAIFHLMRQLRDCSARLNFIDTIFKSNDRRTVRAIGEYFGLIDVDRSDSLGFDDMADTLKAIGSVRFTAHFHTEALIAMRYIAG